jgi:hypothetical protein
VGQRDDLLELPPSSEGYLVRAGRAEPVER